MISTTRQMGQTPSKPVQFFDKKLESLKVSFRIKEPLTVNLQTLATSGLFPRTHKLSRVKYT